MAYLESRGLAGLIFVNDGRWWRWVLIDLEGHPLALGRWVPSRRLARLGAWWYRKPRGVS